MDPREREELIALIRRWSRPLEPLSLREGEGRELKRLKVESEKIRRRGPYRAILFDVYGTLFVSGSGDIGTLEGEGMTPMGGDVLAPFAVSRDLAGLRDRFTAAVRRRHESLRRDRDWPEIQVEEIWTELLELRRPEEAREFSLRFELAVNPVYPMPGVQETLRQLQRRGLPLGIVSNAQFFTPLLFPAFLGEDLESLGFNSDLSVYSFREGEAKPSIKLFQKIGVTLRARGIETEEALFVGNDMLNDVWAAKEAGLVTALFAGDGRSLRLRSEDPRCKNLIPDLVVEDLTELAALEAG